MSCLIFFKIIGEDRFMKNYIAMTQPELLQEQQTLLNEYAKIKEKGLKLDMSRGKPGADQLDLSMGLLDCVTSSATIKAQDGTDCRNYGVLDGIPEAKALMAQLMEVSADEVIVGGNSSLNLMYDAVSRAMTHGVPGSERPWCKLDTVKFLCPVPGYDRHFGITQHFGVEMIPVDMTPDGPDMEQVARYVEADPAVKGIWCVPKYSNPQGYSYSDETVRAFAALKPAASDFRIFWDNAYCVHDLEPGKGDRLLSILEACKQTGKEDMVYLFCSTSKITFPGGGLSAIGASANNISHIKKSMSMQTIGHDKLNQLAHARYFKDVEGLRSHMERHAAILRPKFVKVQETLSRELDGLEIAQWTKPNGGYFISLDVLEGCAKRTLALCKDAGVVMTPAGATHPYGNDPKDVNIRIAPTFPPVTELETAAELLCLCVRLAAVEKLLATK